MKMPKVSYKVAFYALLAVLVVGSAARFGWNAYWIEQWQTKQIGGLTQAMQELVAVHNNLAKVVNDSMKK